MFVIGSALKQRLTRADSGCPDRKVRCTFLGAALERQVVEPLVSGSAGRQRAVPGTLRFIECMGLNASKLRKQEQQQQGKKKNKDNAKQVEGTDAPSQIDTNRRDFMFQMLKVGKTLPNGKQILKEISLAFFPGAKIGVVGPNGAGKSTLLRIMAGVDKEFEGEARPMRTATIGYLPQEPQLDDGETVIENVMAGVAEIQAKLQKLEKLSQQLADPSCSPTQRQEIAQEIDQVQAEIEAVDGYNLESMLERAMDALRVPPPDTPVKILSGGERRRVALVRLLLRRPDLLLLDEPTNHLDAESVLWLEQYLSSYYTGTVVAITHSRSFLENTCEWILELENGRGIPHQGNYSSWLEAKQKRLEQEKKDADVRRRLIATELEWIRAAPAARMAKNKARVERFEELYQSQQQADEQRSQLGTMNQIRIPVGPYLGEQVIEAEGLHKWYGERCLISDASFSIPRGSVVGIIGGNGAGKSTLFRLITGQDKPSAGVLRVGETVKLMYADQNRETLDPNKTVFEEICGDAHIDTVSLGNRVLNARAYCAWFNFKGADQQKRVGVLSGGERNRLNLAKAILNREHGGAGNVLLLDEPGNDLDTTTLANLEQAIIDFPGVVLAISHDPWFLSRVTTHILAFEGDSQLRFYAGGFEAYQEDRKARLGENFINPTRLKFRPLPKM
jgi:ATP-binding cassette ChvD family protein